MSGISPIVDLFFLGAVGVLQAERDMQRTAVADAFPQAIQPVGLGFADGVLDEIEGGLAIVALDWEYFLENGLETDVFTPGRRRV